MDEQTIQSLSILKSSLHRRKIVESLSSSLLTPSEISKITNLRLNHVSMYLLQLKKAGLLECLNEESKKGRIYQLTDLGKKTLKLMKIDPNKK